MSTSTGSSRTSNAERERRQEVTMAAKKAIDEPEEETPAQRQKRYAKDYDVDTLAAMLVETEELYEKEAAARRRRRVRRKLGF
jgi:hypothetical protein